MDSDDEVIGAQYSSGKRLRADLEKPYDSLTLEAPELKGRLGKSQGIPALASKPCLSDVF